MKKQFSLFSAIILSIMLVAACSDDENVIYNDIKEEMTDYTVSINVNATSTSATALFSVKSGAAGIKYAIGTESDRAAFTEDTLESIVTREGDSEFSRTFTGLYTGEEYTIFARAYDAEGKLYTVASQKLITSEQNEDIQADLQYVSDFTAGIKMVVDQNLYYRIDYALGQDSDRAAFNDGTLSSITTVTEIPAYTANYFDLTPETSYTFFCKFYDRTDVLIDTREISFSTYAEDACPGLDQLNSTIDVYKGIYEFVPNDKCGKIVALVSTRGAFDELYIDNPATWSGNLYEMLPSWLTIAANGIMESTGSTLEVEYINSALLLNQRTEAYVMVYDVNERPFAIYHYEFEGPSYDSSLELGNVTIDVTDITSTGATYNIVADDNTLLFYYETIHANWYDLLIAQGTDAEEYMKQLLLSDYLPHYVVEGGKSLTVTEPGAAASTRYYLGVWVINGNGVNGGAGSLILREYTTAAE